MDHVERAVDGLGRWWRHQHLFVGGRRDGLRAHPDRWRERRHQHQWFGVDGRYGIVLEQLRDTLGRTRLI